MWEPSHFIFPFYDHSPCLRLYLYIFLWGWWHTECWNAPSEILFKVTRKFLAFLQMCGSRAPLCGQCWYCIHKLNTEYNMAALRAADMQTSTCLNSDSHVKRSISQSMLCQHYAKNTRMPLLQPATFFSVWGGLLFIQTWVRTAPLQTLHSKNFSLT